MKDTLIFLLQKIVDHPDDIDVTEEGEESRVLLTIHANQEDLGKIIGKNGRIIKAIRDLVKLMATKQNLYVDVPLERVLELNNKLTAYFNGEIVADLPELEKIQRELWKLSYYHDHALSHGIENVRVDIRDEHTSFCLMTYGSIVRCDLLADAYKLGVQDLGSYFDNVNGIENEARVTRARNVQD